MEKYINEGTIVKTSEFRLSKNLLICPLCNHLMLEPIMCSNCQVHYCNNCIENRTCPNNCTNSILIKVIEQNRAVTRFKYKCIKGCGTEISYNDIKSHYNTNCLLNKNKSKIKVLTSEQVAEYRNEGKSINYMSSKIIIIYLYLIL